MIARQPLSSLVFLGLMVATAALGDPRGWPSPRPRTHGVFLPDSTYSSLSGKPIESMSQREFDAWLRERQLRLSLAVAREAYPGWSIARPWPRAWAGFVSDSVYEALSAMPIDSLGEREYEVVMQERQLRALREPGASGHAVLMTDADYEALSALPLDSLSDRQYDMLTRERELRAPKPADPGETHLLGFTAFLMALGGFALGASLVASAYSHAFGW